MDYHVVLDGYDRIVLLYQTPYNKEHQSWTRMRFKRDADVSQFIETLMANAKLDCPNGFVYVHDILPEGTRLLDEERLQRIDVHYADTRKKSPLGKYN